jgi:hypothetical protein
VTLLLVAKLGASLLSILLLAWLARWLGLGSDPRIRNEEEAKRLAFEGLYGFEGIDAAVDRAGMSALVRDGDNRHVLISRVGNHFVTRLVSLPFEGRLDQKLLTIDLREPDIAPVTLNLGEKAQYWASGLRHLRHG